MRCKNCQLEIDLSDKFCRSCGVLTIKEEDIKSSGEITIDWIKKILEAQSYKVEIDKENSNKIIAHHELRSNLIVSINKILSIITIQSFYNIKKPRWGKKKNFLNALNKANSSNWLCTFVSYEPFDTLAILSFIYISEKLSTQDIAQFLEHYENCLNSAINNSGIREFT